MLSRKPALLRELGFTVQKAKLLKINLFHGSLKQGCTLAASNAFKMFNLGGIPWQSSGWDSALSLPRVRV